MEYYVAFNAEISTDFVEDFRFPEILEGMGLGHLDRFSDEATEALDGWGFCSPTSLEHNYQEIFSPGDIQFDNEDLYEFEWGGVSINKWHPFLKSILGAISPDRYFDEDLEEVSEHEFLEKLKTKEDYDVYVCELEPPC